MGGPLTSEVLKNALTRLIKTSQLKVFSKEIQLLKANKLINRNCRVFKLKPDLERTRRSASRRPPD